MSTLRGRLTAFVMLGIGFVLAVGSFVLYHSVKDLLVSNFDQALRDKVRVLTSLSGGVSFEFTDQSLSEFEPGPESEYYQIWLPSGDLIAKSPSLGSANLPFHKSSSEVIRDLTLPDGRAGRSLSLSLGSDDDFRFTLAQGRTALDGTLQRVRLGSAFGIFSMLCLVFIATSLAVRFGLDRLVRLGEEARSLEVEARESGFSSERSVRELQPIIDQLNHLLERMRLAVDRERRFSSHAAHELLTPIAEMRALADVELAIQPDSRLAADALAIAQQMEELVGTLLQLARSQGGKPLPQDNDVVISDLIQEIWEPLGEEARERRLVCDFDWDSPVRIRTNRAALCTILKNLLKNAVIYTPVEGTVRSRITGSADAWEVRFSNIDSTLAPADLEHLFDPLWRKDAARTSGHHSGLGLPLSQSLAEQLNLSLEADVSSDGWFSITLSSCEPSA